MPKGGRAIFPIFEVWAEAEVRFVNLRAQVSRSAGANGKRLRTFPEDGGAGLALFLHPGVSWVCGARMENRFALFLHPGLLGDAGCGRKTASHFSCTRRN